MTTNTLPQSLLPSRSPTTPRPTLHEPIIIMSSMTRRNLQAMADKGATLDDMKPYMEQMAKVYVDHAYDRHKLRSIVCDAARSILKSKSTNDAVAEQFFQSVFTYARGEMTDEIVRDWERRNRSKCPAAPDFQWWW